MHISEKGSGGHWEGGGYYCEGGGGGGIGAQALDAIGGVYL